MRLSEKAPQPEGRRTQLCPGQLGPQHTSKEPEHERDNEINHEDKNYDDTHEQGREFSQALAPTPDRGRPGYLWGEAWHRWCCDVRAAITAEPLAFLVLRATVRAVGHLGYCPAAGDAEADALAGS